MRVLIFIVATATVLFLQCSKSQPILNCEIANPCSEQSPVSAKFTIEEVTSPVGSTPENRTLTDTSFAGRNIRFYAMENNANYHWTLGAEEIFDREFYRFFPEELSNSNIPVTLKVEKEPNHNCFPDDDGMDSLTKILNIYDPYPGNEAYFNIGGDSEKYTGIFRMADSLTGDSIIVEIQKWQAFEDENSYPLEHFKIINQTANGHEYFAYSDTIIAAMSAAAFRQIRLSGMNNYSNVSIYIDLQQITNLFFQPNPAIEDLELRHFKGLKIN